ncbi:MAG: hypothetical protein ACFCU3_10055 [Verrucomicrobiales bacterium]
MKFRTLGMAVFLAVQAAWVVRCLRQPTKFFAWVPYDQISIFSCKVYVNGRRLSNKEVGQRYRFEYLFRENRIIGHVIFAIERRENMRKPGEKVAVELNYSSDGTEPKFYYWPDKPTFLKNEVPPST